MKNNIIEKLVGQFIAVIIKDAIRSLAGKFIFKKIKAVTGLISFRVTLNLTGKNSPSDTLILFGNAIGFKNLSLIKSENY